MREKTIRILRIILGLGCAVAGILPPYVMYAVSGNGSLLNPKLLWGMTVSAAAAFFIWGCCRLWIRPGKGQIIVGALGCYGSFLVLLFIAAALKGGVAETLMWSPVIALFGIPIMAPLVAMTWLGATVAFPARSKAAIPTPPAP